MSFFDCRWWLSARCMRWLAVLKTLGGSTKCLHTHLSSRHENKFSWCKLLSVYKSMKRRFVDYFSKKYDTLDYFLAQLTALDDFPFNLYITFNNLRLILISKDYSTRCNNRKWCYQFRFYNEIIINHRIKTIEEFKWTI